jgi:hypothetical protein
VQIYAIFESPERIGFDELSAKWRIGYTLLAAKSFDCLAGQLIIQNQFSDIIFYFRDNLFGRT